MRILILFFVFSFAIHSHADPIELANSESPNGDYFITIKPSPNDYDEGSGTLQIRQKKTSKILGSFEWYQFGPHISAISARVLWKSDSQAVALNWYQARGWTGSQVYARTTDKWCSLVANTTAVRKNSDGQWKSRGKGHFVAVAWLPNDILKMDYSNGAYRFDKARQVELANDLWIYYKLRQNLDGPFLDRWSIDEQPTQRANSTN